MSLDGPIAEGVLDLDPCGPSPGGQASASSRPGLSTRTVTWGFAAAAILLTAIVPFYNALIRPWPNAVYSVSDDGMTIGLNGMIGPGRRLRLRLRVASAMSRMWSAADDRPLVVELNSAGGAVGAAEMMAYSLFLANRLTRQGTVTVVGQDFSLLFGLHLRFRRRKPPHRGSLGCIHVSPATYPTHTFAAAGSPTGRWG